MVQIIHGGIPLLPPQPLSAIVLIECSRAFAQWKQTAAAALAMAAFIKEWPSDVWVGGGTGDERGRSRPLFRDLNSLKAAAEGA